MMNDFTLRWYDQIDGKSTEFKATTEEEFCEAAINAAIDHRVSSVKTVGLTCHYPQARLEVQYEPAAKKKWQHMRFAWNCPPIQLPPIGSRSGDVCGKHESDAERIKSLTHVWWLSIVRWCTSYVYHTMGGSGIHRPLTTVEQG